MEEGKKSNTKTATIVVKASEVENKPETSDTDLHGASSSDGQKMDAVTVTDEEVDKFYAIIHRIHSAKMAALHAKKKPAADCYLPWKPEFRLEDFGERVEIDKTRGEERKKRCWLDLNKLPDSGGGNSS